MVGIIAGIRSLAVIAGLHAIFELFLEYIIGLSDQFSTKGGFSSMFYLRSSNAFDQMMVLLAQYTAFYWQMDLMLPLGLAILLFC